MDNNAILNQFDEIEKRVEKLIKVCKTLEVENAALTEKVGRLESELREKGELESRHAEVKALIRTKIDNLMERLEGVTETGQEQ